MKHAGFDCFPHQKVIHTAQYCDKPLQYVVLPEPGGPMTTCPKRGSITAPPAPAAAALLLLFDIVASMGSSEIDAVVPMHE